MATRLAVVLLLCSLISHASAACLGNACVEQQEAARAAGLLGSTGGLRASCSPQTYPKIGSLQPVTIPSRILDLKWAAGPNGTSNEKYIFALTSDIDGSDGGHLWRSDNYGSPSSWKDMTEEMSKLLPPGEQTLLGVVDLIWHPGRPERILFQGKGRYHWVSSDYGQTLKAVNTPSDTIGYVQEIKPHPHQPDWLLAKVRRDACILDRGSKLCAFDLFLSQDFASSWTNLTAQSQGRIASFRDFDWGAKMAMFAGKPTPDETIFATVYQSSASQKGMYPGWDKDLHYVVSTDFFKTPVQKQVPCGNLFEVVAHKVFLAVPSDCPLGPDGKPRQAPSHAMAGRTVTMYVSDADGDEFSEACLPTSLEDDGYNLVRTHDDYGAFILADHAEEGSRGPTSDSPVSDVYAPAYNASFFTLGLRNVYRRMFIVDFTRIEALPGVYIANAVDDSALGPDSGRAKPAQFMRTKISFNGGSSWDYLPPPASYRYAQCNTCPPGAKPEDCRLHLHGPTSWFAPEGPRPNVYAHPSAPGLILGTGNVGAHLDFGSTTTCTFMSRDGGLTWEDVADNPAIYEIGAHGDLVVLSPHKSEGPSDTVYFSLDQGGCLHKVQLPEAITVDNIRVDPTGSGHTFIVHGVACVKTDARPACSFTGGGLPPAKMFVLDLKNMMEGDLKECNAAAGSSDFEQWTLVKPDTCLLGQKYTMQRRKRDAGCVSGSTYQPPAMQTEACNCTLEDLECEYGFQKMNGSCVAMPGLDQSMCPNLANSGYKVSHTNMRLIHADQCVGVSALIDDTDGKGDQGGSGGGGGGGGGKHGGGGGGHSTLKKFFIVVLVLGILLVVSGVVWVHCLPEGLKADVADKVAPLLGLLGALAEQVMDRIVTAWDWLRAKLGGIGGSGSEARAAYFEPLSDRLELDPEDHTSPPLFGNR